MTLKCQALLWPIPLTRREPIMPGDCIIKPLLGLPGPLVFSLASRCMLMEVIIWIAVGCSLMRQGRYFLLVDAAAFEPPS